METTDAVSKNLEYSKQAGIVITSIASLALAIWKIRSIAKGESTDTTEK